MTTHSKSTNKQRRERGDWPNNERYFHVSQDAWMQEVKDKEGNVIAIKPMYNEGKTYKKAKRR